MSTVDEMLAQARAGAEPSAEVRARVGWALKSALANPPAPIELCLPKAAPASLGGGSLGSYLTVAAIAAGLGFGAGLAATRLFPPSAPSQSASVNAHERPEAPVTSPGTPHAEARTPQTEAPASGEADASSSRESENKRPAHRIPLEPSTTSNKATAAPVSESDRAQQDQLLFVVSGLQRAQTALKNNHPVQALLLLDELDANYPSEVLIEERSAVRVHAQCAAGHSPTSLMAARSFVRTYPTSLYVTRIRKACGIDDEPQGNQTPTE